jgi:fatty-acyl-CoA synthase
MSNNNIHINTPATSVVRSRTDLFTLERTVWRDHVSAHNTYEVLRRAASRQPQNAALRFVLEGDPDAPAFTLTYQSLFARVTQAANAFHRVGIDAGKAVALLLPNLPETHAALWGAQAAGIANPINPMLEIEHIAAIIDETKAEALVTLAALPDSDIWQKAVAVAERCPSIRTIFMVDIDAYVEPAHRGALQVLRVAAPSPKRNGLLLIPFNAALAQEPADHLVSGRDIQPGDVCAYFHTGGTTGLPKVARHTPLNECFVAAMLPLLQPDHHIVLCGLPLFHVNGAIVTGLAAFNAGWEVVLLTPQGYRGRGVLPNFWRHVQRFGATSFSGVPTVFATLANLPLNDADISTLRVAFCGAAPLPPEVARRFEEVAGIPLCEGYGLTEAACISTVHPASVPRRAGSVGLRLPFQALQPWKINGDGKAVEPCINGEVGVIGLNGPNVFPGYLRERDNEGIWLAPGWLNTGDLGYLDSDGFLHLTGRAKDLIIRGGHNIDPAMIEDALLHHPAIAMVAAVAQPDPHAGELPVAYVTLKPGAEIGEDDLLAAARELVPERAATPVRIEILPQMVLTAVGKIAKAELRLRAARHVLAKLLAEQSINGELTVAATPDRGTVVQLRCPASDIGRASVALAPFPYVIDVQAQDGEQQ